MHLNTLSIVLLVLVAVAVVFAIIVSMQPADFRVARSLKIDSPASALFANVSNLRSHEAWSPFIQMDPAMTLTYSGPETGIGASQHWDSKTRAGEGRMTLTDTRPDEMIGFRLDFLRPFKATNRAEFTFVPQGNGETLVTWSMTGHNHFFFKAMSMFMDCDKMVGPEFEKGLAQLKTLSEMERVAAAR